MKEKGEKRREGKRRGEKGREGCNGARTEERLEEKSREAS